MKTSIEEDDAKSTSSPEEAAEDDDKPPDTTLPSIKNGPAGLTVRGGWKEITSFCDHFNYTIKKESFEADLPAERLGPWNEWHPREGEGQEHVRERTAAQAAFDPKEAHREELKKSVFSFNCSRESIKEGDQRGAAKNFWNATYRAVKGSLIYLGKVVGKVELFLYRHVMTRFNSSYFDSDLVSANLEDKGGIFTEEQYQIQVKIHDGELQERVQQELGG
ncbi:MAG: DUF5828 family protein [Candidatus Bipolaricaulota bacterium]